MKKDTNIDKSSNPSQQKQNTPRGATRIVFCIAVVACIWVLVRRPYPQRLIPEHLENECDDTTEQCCVLLGFDERGKYIRKVINCNSPVSFDSIRQLEENENPKSSNEPESTRSHKIEENSTPGRYDENGKLIEEIQL
jgi:hypothetical protein